MAMLRKDNKIVNLPRGIYKGTIKDFRSKGLKKTKKEDLFENGYLEILLDNGVLLSQYIMVTPYEKWIFYRIVKAIGLANKIDEYIDFPFHEMFEKELIIELEYESVRDSRYLNVTNVYSLVEGEKLIQFQRARDESRRRSGLLDMNYIEMMNERKIEIDNRANKKEEVEVQEIELEDEYDELIGF